MPSNIGDGFGLAVSGETVHVAWTQFGAIGDYNIHAVSLTSPPVSVDLSGFLARVENGRAVLAWQVTEADNVVGCRVERSEGGSTSSFVELGEALVVPDEGGYCRFIDRQARLDVEYDYRIRVVSRGGESEVFGPFPVRWSAPPRVPIMGPMVPNPFAGSVRTTIQLPEAMTLEISVFDVLGRRVRSILKGLVEVGEHEVTWDGNDDSGAGVAPGNYFVRMTTGGGVVTRKVTLRR
ncbi:MAG: FlgD immunoglobulin-like domain containing protein [Candidatus Eisenbacteria bacterium]|nr:FlgD immunoglobulin-like domain containing protein [Candidatus Eisenbacteria bacterium]